MDDKRGSARAKRQLKHQDEGRWDCSVCTFKNPAEAFKCEMCDVRKGTSTRKPRANQQIVAAQIAQQYAPPPPLKKEKTSPQATATQGAPRTERSSSRDLEKDDDSELTTYEETPPPKEIPSTKSTIDAVHSTSLSTSSLVQTTPTTATHHKKKTRPPRLKNIDRSSAQHMAVTVNNVTVIITDYKPKERRISTDTSLHNNNTNSTNLNNSSDRDSDSLQDTHQQNGEGLSDFEY